MCDTAMLRYYKPSVCECPQGRNGTATNLPCPSMTLTFMLEPAHRQASLLALFEAMRQGRASDAPGMHLCSAGSSIGETHHRKHTRDFPVHLRASTSRLGS